MEKTAFINAAMKYINLRYSVIPIANGSKKPPTGFRWETYQVRRATREEIEHWANEYPNSNLALVTGKLSGIVIIDLDGTEGADSAKKLEIPGNTAIVLTTRGQHIYCKYPDGFHIGNKVGVFDGVDIRGEGGYAIMPPSIHQSGIEYVWGNPIGGDLAELPEWVIKIFYPNYNMKGETPQQKSTVNCGNSTNFSMIAAGTRNDTLFRMACSLRAKGISKAATLAAINVEYLQRCDNSQKAMSPQELETLVNSAYNYENEVKIRPLTDLGNAERLQDRYTGELIYNFEQDKWLHYNGMFWQVDTGKLLMTKAIHIIRSIPLEAKQDDNDMVEEFTKFARKCENGNKIDNMIKRASYMMGISQDDLDKDNMLLNCKNGTINLRTMKFSEHAPTNYITKICNANYSDTATCPIFLKFLDTIFAGNNELIRYVQKAIGYSLTGVTNEQVFFTLHGGGSNGKSTLVETIRNLLGSYSMQAEFSTFLAKKGERIGNDIARLKGARLVSASESGVGKLLDDTLLKQATGGESLTTRFLFQEYFEYHPAFKIFLITNHKPIIKDDSDGMWRRIRLIPFTVTIPEKEKDVDLPNKLYAELDGILQWALDGCKLWQKEGLGEVAGITQATSNYRLEMDVFGRFMDECCITGAECKAKGTELYNAYKHWCEVNNENCWTNTMFGVKLREKGFDKVHVASGNVWKGIGILSEF